MLAESARFSKEGEGRVGRYGKVCTGGERLTAGYRYPLVAELISLLVIGVVHGDGVSEVRR